MKKKICISIGIVFIVIILTGFITNYIGKGKVETERELPKSNTIEIEYGGKIITITDKKDIETIESILLGPNYNGAICDGINTHKITLNNEVYYIKEACKEIQKGNKQARITEEDLNTIKSIIYKQINDEQNENEYCEADHSTEIAGEALTEWECKLCGITAINSNTNIPVLCKNCAQITGRCYQCGKLKK